MAHVSAEIVDENTLSVDGVRFVREREEEALLRPIYSFSPNSSSFAPDLECSNCHYTRNYFAWYRLTGYKERTAKFCPGCGFKILGVISHDEEGRS